MKIDIGILSMSDLGCTTEHAIIYMSLSNFAVTSNANSKLCKLNIFIHW